mgnify:FL=1
MKQEQKTHVSADALIQLLKGAKSIRWQLALGVVMSLVLVVCALVIPTQMGALVQILIDYFDAPETGASVLAQLAPGLLALLGVYLLRAAVSYGKMQLLNRAVSRYFTCNLRIQISDKIQRLPVSFVDHTPVGDILSRMTEDVSRIGGSLHTVLDTITGGFLQILAIAVVMFLQNWQLSLAVIAFMPVSIWLSAKIAGRSETYFHQMFKQSGELYSVVEEAYTNYATTKAYNLEEHCAKRHAEINDARRVSEAKATYLSAIVQPVITASNSLAYIAINLLGGWLIVRQGVPVGVIVTVVGTGSEVNGEGVITHEEQKIKTSRNYPRCNPVFAMMDPKYTYTVSPLQTAAGGFDMLSHVMETYFSAPDEDNLSDAISEALMRSIIANLPVAIREPENYEARSNLMWASTMAEIGIIKLGKQCDFEAHMIEHQMGAYTDCNHGMGLGVIHPAYYRRICRDGIKKFVKFAVNVWGMSPDGGDEEELAFGGIDALQAFIHEIGLPGTLRELGITDQSLLKTIADSCIRNDGGYRQLTHAEILDILEECY